MADLCKNRQWKVTKHGLESIDERSDYSIEAKRLGEMVDRGDGDHYDWPIHMAEKTWVDIDLFIDAFVKALEFHKIPFDKKVLAASLDQGRQDARRR